MLKNDCADQLISNAIRNYLLQCVLAQEVDEDTVRVEGEINHVWLADCILKLVMAIEDNLDQSNRPQS